MYWRPLTKAVEGHQKWEDWNESKSWIINSATFSIYLPAWRLFWGMEKGFTDIRYLFSVEIPKLLFITRTRMYVNVACLRWH